MDSSPIVVISGQVPNPLIGTDAFQETDMVGVSRPVVKHSFLVKRCEEIPEIVAKAFHIATTGRPGPVVIDVPKDTTDPDITAIYNYSPQVRLRAYNPAVRGNGRQIRKAAAALLAPPVPPLPGHPHDPVLLTVVACLAQTSAQITVRESLGANATHFPIRDTRRRRLLQGRSGA